MRHPYTSLSGLLLGLAVIAAAAQAAGDPSTPRLAAAPTSTRPATPSATTRCPPGTAHQPESRVPSNTTSTRASRSGHMPAPGQSTRVPPCR